MPKTCIYLLDYYILHNWFNLHKNKILDLFDRLHRKDSKNKFVIFQLCMAPKKHGQKLKKGGFFSILGFTNPKLDLNQIKIRSSHCVKSVFIYFNYEKCNLQRNELAFLHFQAKKHQEFLLTHSRRILKQSHQRNSITPMTPPEKNEHTKIEWHHAALHLELQDHLNHASGDTEG